MTFQTGVGTAAMLAVAYVAGRLVRRSAPDLVAYLLVGALLGPTGAGLFDRGGLHDLRPVALAATAPLLVIIGERISLSSFRAAPWIPFVATAGYVLTGLAVFAAAHAAGASDVLAGFLAVLGGGGAPMTVAAIVRGEDASGAYAREIVGLHASCDVLVTLAFAVAFPVAVLSQGGSVLGSGSAGWIAGLSFPTASLAVGAIVGSTAPGNRARRLFGPIRRLEPVLYVLFFTLAGAAIRLDAVWQLGVIGLAYLATRAVVKVGAGFAAARVSALDPDRSRRVALGSLPHAGVSVALAAAASAELPGRGIASITLGGVVVFELVGALIVRAQLRAAAPPAVSSPAGA